MSLITAVLFGIIQGITEFLPVSSSGHLVIAENILNVGNPETLVSFNVLLHLGTLIAVFAVYWKDIIALIPAFFSLIGKVFKGKLKFSQWSFNERFVLLIIISTIPLFVAALVEDYFLFISNYLSIVGAILVLNGFMLYCSDKLSSANKKRNKEKEISEMTPSKALAIGAFQAMAALLPGLSRSGSTITCGLLCGLKREQAVKYSFIMSLPAIAGACILKIPELFRDTSSPTQLAIYAAGALVAAVVGVIAMKLLTYISKKSDFRMFAYYCLAIGIVMIAVDIFR